MIENREVARGSRLLMWEATDSEEFEYQPGHVITLALPGQGEKYDWHPYTVVRADNAARRATHLFRVIPTGPFTPRLAVLKPDDPIHFTGRAHKPIRDEVKPDVAHIVGIATGTGIGPLFGYAEQTLALGETRPLQLFLGVREEKDICFGRELDALAKRYPNFHYTMTVTQPSAQWRGLTGRVTESVPALLPDIHAAHFHLVGNGAMVDAMKKALKAAGVDKKRITMEIYFNFTAKASDAEVAAAVGRLGAQVRPPQVAAS